LNLNGPEIERTSTNWNYRNYFTGDTWKSGFVGQPRSARLLRVLTHVKRLPKLRGFI